MATALETAAFLCRSTFVFGISSQGRATFVSRRVRLHPRHPEIGPLGCSFDTRECGELIDWHNLPQKGTIRLTGDCLPGPMTDKFLPERGGASTFPNRMHNDLLSATAGRCLSATIDLFSRRNADLIVLSPLSILSRPDTA